MSKQNEIMAALEMDAETSEQAAKRAAHLSKQALACEEEALGDRKNGVVLRARAERLRNMAALIGPAKKTKGRARDRDA